MLDAAQRDPDFTSLISGYRPNVPQYRVQIDRQKAKSMGVSMGRVLIVQAEELRVRRRQRAQERANQAPVKMMIPLVFLIFPSIFAVLLGPAVPELMRAFSGL